MVRLDHDVDVEMAYIRPSQRARAKGHADGDIRRQQGGGGLIRLDHDGDIEMADIRPSQHARSKRHADGDIRHQRGGRDVMIRLDHDGDVEMSLWPTSGLLGMHEPRSMLKFVGGSRARMKPRIQTWTERRHPSARDTVNRGSRAGLKLWVQAWTKRRYSPARDTVNQHNSSSFNKDQITTFLSKRY
jgi:hypothetical protein